MGLFKKKLTVNQATNLAHTTENAVLIDCRPKEDYAHGHVTGAINIPIAKITEDRILRRFPDQEKIFYIVGNYKNTPKDAAKRFKKLGYKHTVCGGYMEEHYGILTR